MINPYITSGPVSRADFYGRRELVTEITGGRQRAFYVLGARQIGKTSLLHQINTLVPALCLDVQWAAGRLSDLVGQAQWELEGKRERFPWLPVPEAVPDNDLFALLRKINIAAARADQTLWLLVDEAEGLLSIARDDPSVLHRLRGTVQNCSKLRTVLVAAKTLSEANDLTAALGSPFLSGLALRYLGGLSTEAAIALLRQSQSDTSVKVDNALAMRLVSLTNGHPLLLQLLGERLFTAGRLRPPTDEDLAIIGDKMARSDIFSKDFAYLSDGERTIVRVVSDSGRATGDKLKAIADRIFLYGLTSLGYLRREGDSYAIGNVFFARWLNKFAPWGEKSRVSDAGTLNLYKEGSNDMSTDPALQQWAMSILTAATTWLFTQAGEVLKERREKRQAERKPDAPSAKPEPTATFPITTADDLLAELQRKADLAARRMDIETVESLMKRLEERAAKINRYREKEAGGLGLDDQVLVDRRIENEQKKVAEEAEEMRVILERLAGRPLQIPDSEQIEGEMAEPDDPQK